MNITSDCFILYLLLSYQSHYQQKKQEPPRPKFGFLPHSHTIAMPMGYKTMITIFVEENNPLTPNFYNNLIAQLQFHRLTCTCGHSGCLSVHGYISVPWKHPLESSFSGSAGLSVPAVTIPMRFFRLSWFPIHRFPWMNRLKSFPLTKQKGGWKASWTGILPSMRVTAAISSAASCATGNSVSFPKR